MWSIAWHRLLAPFLGHLSPPITGKGLRFINILVFVCFSLFKIPTRESLLAFMLCRPLCYDSGLLLCHEPWRTMRSNVVFEGLGMKVCLFLPAPSSCFSNPFIFDKIQPICPHKISAKISVTFNALISFLRFSNLEIHSTILQKTIFFFRVLVFVENNKSKEKIEYMLLVLLMLNLWKLSGIEKYERLLKRCFFLLWRFIIWRSSIV